MCVHAAPASLFYPAWCPKMTLARAKFGYRLCFSTTKVRRLVESLPALVHMCRGVRGMSADAGGSCLLNQNWKCTVGRVR